MKPPYIINLETSPSQNSPTDSGEEAFRLACKRCGCEVRCIECGTAKAVGGKSLDILAISPNSRDSVVWLIEIKDYRGHPRTKAIDLADEVALKVRDTLAMLIAAAKVANDADERAVAEDALGVSAIRVVLHLEQVVRPSRLYPRAVNPANIRQRLRQLIRFVDPHPLVVDRGCSERVEWSVE